MHYHVSKSIFIKLMINFRWPNGSTEHILYNRVKSISNVQFNLRAEFNFQADRSLIDFIGNVDHFFWFTQATNEIGEGEEVLSTWHVLSSYKYNAGRWGYIKMESNDNSSFKMQKKNSGLMLLDSNQMEIISVVLFESFTSIWYKI